MDEVEVIFADFFSFRDGPGGDDFELAVVLGGREDGLAVGVRGVVGELGAVPVVDDEVAAGQVDRAVEDEAYLLVLEGRQSLAVEGPVRLELVAEHGQRALALVDPNYCGLGDVFQREHSLPFPSTSLSLTSTRKVNGIPLSTDLQYNFILDQQWTIGRKKSMVILEF